MNEVSVRGYNLPDAYHEALWYLNEGDISNCTDYQTRQKEIGLTMIVERPLSEPRISRCFPGGPYELEQYREEILDGILDFEIERGNWAYTYHDRISKQLSFIIEELRRNPDSRRAVISVRDDRDMGATDPACLQNIQFLIRKNRLECKVLFRSNDGVKACFMNAFALICLQEKIANELGVEVGSYTHRVNSFHAYERDWELLGSYTHRIERLGEVYYNYKGDWDEWMEEAKAEIAQIVERLKNG